MRKVFSNSSDVIHKFVERSQNEGRSANCYFEGDKIYSYGRHYLLGEFVNNGKEDEDIFFWVDSMDKLYSGADFGDFVII